MDVRVFVYIGRIGAGQHRLFRTYNQPLGLAVTPLKRFD